MLQIKVIVYQIGMFITFDFCFSKNAILLNILATSVRESSLAKLAAVLESTVSHADCLNVLITCWQREKKKTKEPQKRCSSSGNVTMLGYFQDLFLLVQGPQAWICWWGTLELHPSAREATLKKLTSHIKMLMLVIQMYLPRVVCHSIKYSV